MDEKQEYMSQLDEAIDRMDLETVGALLDRMDALEPAAVSPEDPSLFAARIRKLQSERESMMKHKKTKIILAACLAAALSVGVYASGVWTHFDLFSGGRMVTVTAHDASMTKTEAGELAEEGKPLSPEEAKAAGDNVLVLESKDYDTLEAAAASLNIPVVMPQNTAGLALESISGQDSQFGKTLWVIYGTEGRRMGVTVILDQPASEDSTVISYSDVEGETLAPYKSAKGITFTRIKDEHGDYAVARVGNYQYILIFEGFDEQELRSVIDSADLSVYH